MTNFEQIKNGLDEGNFAVLELLYNRVEAIVKFVDDTPRSECDLCDVDSKNHPCKIKNEYHTMYDCAEMLETWLKGEAESETDGKE